MDAAHVVLAVVAACRIDVGLVLPIGQFKSRIISQWCDNGCVDHNFLPAKSIHGGVDRTHIQVSEHARGLRDRRVYAPGMSMHTWLLLPSLEQGEFFLER